MAIDGAAVSSNAFLTRPVPALVAKASPIEPSWSWVITTGTGGFKSVEYYRDRGAYQGYLVFRVESDATNQSGAVRPFATYMEDIRQAFGRNFSRLPAVFGVSRQTLYNWLRGEVPGDAKQARIVQLANAAAVFRDSQYVPTAGDLSRALLRGRTFLELIAAGEDGQAMAERLLRLAYRGLASKAKLQTILANTAPQRIHASDLGAPALDEDAE